ncbi:MAG: SUMF1/EgtB/PvdO family nonheme iron enzyme [Candidatus Alcyoniella australis]|nr:SUMF1/EgtB/PvdO family nonheme iron enzyme [Candidatus Alcyoniella australis]
MISLRAGLLTSLLCCLLLLGSGCSCEPEPVDDTPPATPEQRAICYAIFITKRAAGYTALNARSLPLGKVLVAPEWYEPLAADWPEVERFALFSRPQMRLDRPVIEYRAALIHSRSTESATLLGCPQGMWRMVYDTSGRALLLNSFADDPQAWLGEPGELEIDQRDRILISVGRLFDSGGAKFKQLERYSSVLRRADAPLYRIGRIEVTNAQYAAFLNSLSDPALVEQYYDLYHPSAKIVLYQSRYLPLRGCEDYPVTAVGWAGADAFCMAAHGKLPSDREWELAARGVSDRPYPWGDDFDPARVNLYEAEDGYNWLAPADSMPRGAGRFGTLHQAGNVFEWIDRAPSDSPQGKVPAANLRGGGWNTLAQSARSDRQDNNKITAANEHNGLRCCWPLSTPWGERALGPAAAVQPGPPVRVIPPEAVKMGAAMPMFRRGAAYLEIWAVLSRHRPALIDPHWYPDVEGLLEGIAPFAVFTQREVRLQRPIVEYRSALLPDSSIEGEALKGGPPGMWSVSRSYDGRSLLVNRFNEDPERWLGTPGNLDVPAEDKVLVPAGTYRVGASGDAPGRAVAVEAFEIGKYEVTNAQLAAVLNELHGEPVDKLVDLRHGAIKVVRRNGRYLPLAGCERMPATCITWYGADQICRSLGGRLPSGDQWEIAARGNDSRLYPWGNLWEASRANVWGDADGYPWLAPVDGFTSGAGPFGTLQQAGNAYEWVDNSGRQRNPLDPVDMGELRGGSWMTLADTARLDVIDGNYLYVANDHNGVRCVWQPVQSDQP